RWPFRYDVCGRFWRERLKEGVTLGANQQLRDPRGALAVAERIVRRRHLRVGGIVVEQAARLRENAVGIGSHQERGARGDSFWPLGRLAHDEDRLAERGRLLLYAAAVGQHEMADVEQPR